MILVHNFGLAVFFFVISMICWGSWANTLKMTEKKWEFPLYYWDYSIGIVLLMLIAGLTMGSIGTFGRSFIPDLLNANPRHVLSMTIL